MKPTAERNSGSSSLRGCNAQHNLTNRSMVGQEAGITNGAVAPWSRDDYFSKLKQEIKEKQSKKRLSTVRSLCQKISQSNKRYLASRVKTVNLKLANLTCEERKFQWNTVLSKKVSSKLIPKEIAINQKISEQQARLEEPASVRNPPIHHKKSSLKQFPQSKPRTERLLTEGEYQRIKDWKEEQYRLNKWHEKKSSMFFFEAKHASKVSSREKMITRIRNLDRGKVERAITINY